MNLEKLQQLLKHPKPNARLGALHIIGMVDEVRALPDIAARLPREDVPKIAAELRSIGRHLQALANDGYDTIEALCQFHNVYSEVLTHADEEEFKTINRMAYGGFTESNEAEEKMKRKAVDNATLMILSQAVGAGIGAGISAASVDMSSNMGSLTEAMKKQKKRDRPTIPTERDITRWIKLSRSEDADEREQAFIQMNAAKNPIALQYMAYAHYNDADERVRATAKRLGRSLYWNTIYYEMEQDGTIEKIMHDFAETLGIKLDDDVTKTQEMPAPPAVDESIADILARAEKTRQKRGKRR